MPKGKFIVIDGTDGSGKKTQTDLIVARLKDCGLDVVMTDFPQYGNKSAGLVEEYLNGKYGSADEVGPYRGSIFYACDRYDASFQIKKWLNEGKIVVSNRYVTANMGHQGGKIQDDFERKNYFRWLYGLEYELFGIPKPDLNIILHVDAAVAQSLVDQKGAREYIGGEKRDIHEADIDHLRQAEKVYFEIANTFPDFTLIECSPNNIMLSRERINDLIWEKIVDLIGYENIYPHKYLIGDKIDFLKPNDIKEPQYLKVERIHYLAKLPERAHTTDAGLDVFSCDYYSILPGERIAVSTGIKLSIPDGYAGLIWDKSGVSYRSGIHTLAGVVDSGYRGELKIIVANLSHDIYNISPGQKIAQLLIQKIETPIIKEEKINDITDRKDGHFGSTGLY